MPSNPSGNPEPFSLSPLLSLLPDVGNVARLEGVASSLFVHFEAVQALLQVPEGSDPDGRLSAESAMLRHVLDWLSAQRDEGGIGE